LSFVSASLNGSGVLFVTHSLGSQFVGVNVYDDNNSLLVPDSVVANTSNTLTVGLSSYAPITGTWHLSAIANGGTSIIQGPTYYTAPFQSSSLVANELSVTHSLGARNVIVQVYDNNYSLVIPNYVHTVDASSLKLGLASYAPITGTWNVAVIAGGTTYTQTYVTGTWRDSGSNFVTTSSVSIDSQNLTATQHGTDTYLYISGTTGLSGSAAKVAVFGGDVVISGSINGVYHPLTASTTHWYKCNEIAGALTNSVGGNANPMTSVTGPPIYSVPTVFTYATPSMFWYHGGSSDGAIATGLTASAANGLTLECIIQPSNFSQTAIILEIANTTRTNGMMHLVINAGSVAVTTYIAPTQVDTNAPAAFNFPGKMHIMGTYKGTTQKLYINGIFAGSSNSAVNISAIQMNQIALANALVGTVPYTGFIADARITLDELPQSYAIEATKAMMRL